MYVLLSLLLVLSFLIYKKRRLFVLSPVDLFFFYFVAVMVATTLYHFYFPAKEKFNYYDLDKISRKTFYNTITIFIKMLFLFLAGVGAYTFKSKSYRRISGTSIVIVDTKNFTFNISLITKIAVGLLTFSVILVYLDYGNGLFIRSQYIPEKSSILKTIYQNLFIILSALLGIIYRKNKSFGLFGIVVTILVGIALGSRAASIYLIIFGFFLSLFIESRHKLIVFYSWFIPFVVIFFGINLSLRSESHEHGLIPYFMVMGSKPLVLFTYVLSNIYYTLVFGFYDTVKTIAVYRYASVGNLVTCLSPLPGAWTNWPVLAPRLRVYETLPFTAIGEMSKYPIFSVFYYSVLGFYFSFVDNIIKSSIENKKYIFPIIQSLLLALYVIHSFEYNLRSTHRFVVYSMVFMIVWHFTRNNKFVFKAK